jgi:hypothetical protein
MIMTHGSIANIVPENETALSFESGESWSEVLKQPDARVEQALHPLPSVAIACGAGPQDRLASSLVVDLKGLTLRERALLPRSLLGRNHKKIRPLLSMSVPSRGQHRGIRAARECRHLSA